jgi:hypothetical protein
MILLEAALRVLAAYREHLPPDPEHLRLLFTATNDPEKITDPVSLAMEVVEREVEKLKRRRAAGAGQ